MTEIEELTVDMSQRSLWWVKPSYKLPNTDEEVLVIVTGHHGNITLDHAVQLANYFPDEGWVLTEFYTWSPDEFSIYAWATIHLPRELEASNA